MIEKCLVVIMAAIHFLEEENREVPADFSEIQIFCLEEVIMGTVPIMARWLLEAYNRLKDDLGLLTLGFSMSLPRFLIKRPYILEALKQSREL